MSLGGTATAASREPFGTVARRIADWFVREGRDLPWRRAGFSAWGSLVSEFMLQQTPVARVIPRLEMWLARWPTPAALAAEPAAEAIRAWGGLGYPRRALALHSTATAITGQHGGVVPQDVDKLLGLPGIGPYTARAVAVFAYGHRHPVVDTNVRRVLARALDGRPVAGPPSTRTDLERMEGLLPRDRARSVLVNAGTMELGAIVCTARAPRCGSCPIADDCAWRAAGYPAAVPGDRAAPRQKRYEGSDRQVRGLVLRELRASDTPVPDTVLRALWADAAQLARALGGLHADGLLIRTSAGWALPE